MRFLVRAALIATGFVGCGIVFANDQTLTVEQARQRVAGPEPGEVLDLSQVTSLPPDAAKELVSHEGDVLLGGLKQIFPETATWLASRKGYTRLSGLVTPSEDVMRALGNHKGVLHLHLPGLINPLFSGPDGPKYFSAHDRKVVDSLEALAEASKSTLHITGGHRVHPQGMDGGVWRALAQKKEGGLSFYGWCYDERVLRPLPGDLMKTTAVLYFPDLEKISAADAKNLTKHHGNQALLGIQTLDSAVAKLLAKYPGRLILPGMTAITDETASQLKNCDAQICFTNLINVTDKTFLLLRENPNIDAPKLKR
jgi:hypothetical protein